MPEFQVEIVGRSGAAYDRYPPSWPQGSAEPNLETFARELLDRGTVERSDVLVVGSRGGQVVLPSLWRALGDWVPPAVVINGGCAMNLPAAIHWPKGAVTFLLMGGLDTFRGATSVETYIADTKSRVPAENGTTAILFVKEMMHMPQSKLLGAVLPLMLKALLTWKEAGPSLPPVADFQALLTSIAQARCWSGHLLYTHRSGVWKDTTFGPGGPEPAKRHRFGVSCPRQRVKVGCP